MDSQIGNIVKRWAVGLIVCLVLVALCLPASAGLFAPHSVRANGGMTQVLFAGYYTNMNTGSTQYTSLQGGLPWTLDANMRGQQSVSTSGTISNLRITLSAAPGVGKSYTFTVMKNGAAQTLSVVISDAATSGTDSAHPISVVAGDLVYMRQTPSGTPTAANARWTCTFTADAANESLVLCATWFYNGMATAYCPVSFAGYYSGSSTESPAWQVAPCSGTLDNLYITLVDSAPGAGTSWRCDLRVNNAGSDLTVTIADAATTGSDVVHDVSINAGDTLDFIIMIASGAPASCGASIGMRFTSSVNGESMILGTNRNTNVAGGVRYAYAQANKDNLAWQSSEVTLQLAQACTISNLYVRLGASPGYYNYNTLVLRVNSTSSALSVTVVGPATTGSDTTNTVSLADGNLIDMMNTASSGTAVTVHWGMACYINPYSIPIVTSSSATNIEETSATLSGNITDIGGENCDQRGFVWDVSSHADPGNVTPPATYASNWTESGSFGVGNFSYNVTVLTPGQIYYFRSYAHNSAGWDYSDTEQNFTTKPNEPSGFSTSGPTASSLDLSWAKGTGANNTYIRGKKSSYPADRTDGYLVYNNTSTSVTDAGLDAASAYYYRAWSWNTVSGFSDLYAQTNGNTTTPPSVLNVTPNSGNRGESGKNETIDGTNFTGATSVSFGDGITVSSFVVYNSTLIFANITIAWDSALGARDVSVTSANGTGTKVAAFVIAAPVPTVSNVVPNYGHQGDYSYGATINGDGFINSTVVNFGSGINVTGFAINSYSQITTALNITASAALGFRNVSVTSPGGVGVLVNGFEVKAAGGGNVTLTIGAVVPNEGARGNTMNVTIVGTGFTGLLSVDFGSDILVNSFVISSNTTVSTSITINDTAVLGARNVSVTGPSGTETLVGGFTVMTDIGSVLGTLGLFGFGLTTAVVLSVFAWRVRFLLLSVVAAAAWLGMLVFLLTNTSSPGLTWLGTAGVTILSLIFIGMCVAMLLLQLAVDASEKDAGGSVWRRTSLRISRKKTSAERQDEYQKQLRGLSKRRHRRVWR